jgi:DNA ligase D-like protein (predicted 3'-phosphoesterase)
VIFVVQQHRATTLHWDLRLEVDGVLVSWAVPKEPSTDPHVKRLAVHVDDHALEHADYEDENKTTWDRGTYDNLTEPDAATAIADGHIKVELHGDRLAGVYALTRTSMNGDPRNWILVRVGSD